MLKIPKQYKSLSYIYDIEWQDIFAVWRAYESYQKDWQDHWEERGFKSWDEWRKDYISPLEPENRKWSIWRIEKPSDDIAQIYGVPARGWRRHFYGDKITMPLQDVVEKMREKYSIDDEGKNEKIELLKNNFPYQTMLTGIINKDKIILIEGMHRGVALTMMDEQEIIGDVTIALAEYDEDLNIMLSKKLDN